VPDQQPRRRQTDKDRRAWPDERLNELLASHERLSEIVGEQGKQIAVLVSQAEDDADLRTALSRLPDRVNELKATHHRDMKDVRDEFRGRFNKIDVAHDRTETRAKGVDPDTEEPLPPPRVTLTWGGVAKIITIFAAILAPTAAVIAALIQSHHP
jgi:hypothetical protein